MPLREISAEAGQRNHSAVNYYFHNRQELVDAVIARRLAPMERERALMLATLDPHGRRDPHALLRIMVLPMAAVDSGYYARFLSAATPYLRAESDRTNGEVWPTVLDLLARAVPTRDPQACRRRLEAVGTTMFALLAEHERRTHSGALHGGTIEEIIGMLAAMLTAPISTAAADMHAG